MSKLKRTLFRSWFTLETLEDRIYHIILDVAVFVTLLSLALGLLQRQPAGAVITIGVTFLYLVVIQFITIRKPKYVNICRNALVLGLNLVFFPLRFFFCGGIYSGMILFYLIGLGLCAILLRGKFGTVMFFVCLVWMEVTTAISFYYPQFTQEMTPVDHLADVDSTFLLAGVALSSIISLILRAYMSERRHNEELMTELRNLSVIDTLSGLYNRRELFRRLEVMYDAVPRVRTEKLTRAGHYIFMVDVDDFKKLNDTYGHSFGDEVLVSVSKELHDLVHAEAGELTARYGGEEFVSVLSAGSMEEAFARVDGTRQKINALRWEANPSVRISISGGLISCEAHPDLTRAMHDVDELLYQAKAMGKNHICME